jgi:hypothetical protein
MNLTPGPSPLPEGKGEGSKNGMQENERST